MDELGELLGESRAIEMVRDKRAGCMRGRRVVPWSRLTREGVEP
jgi:hypothetical protein